MFGHGIEAESLNVGEYINPYFALNFQLSMSFGKEVKMPYLKIETNKELNVAFKKEILKKTSEFVAGLLGKSENWVMISMNQGVPMMFAGNTQPLAYVEMKSIGLPEDKCSDFSNALCNFIESELGIPSDRIYIDFKGIERSRFGWNKGTF